MARIMRTHTLTQFDISWGWGALEKHLNTTANKRGWRLVTAWPDPARPQIIICLWQGRYKKRKGKR